MDLGLDGKRALVLGASQGLGAAIAAALAREGARVTAAARGREKTEAWIAAQPDAARARLTYAPLDLADRASVDALADALLADGGVDVLVNNSGGPPPGSAMDATAEQWSAQFQAMAAHLLGGKD